jgi:hypothetical protein
MQYASSLFRTIFVLIAFVCRPIAFTVKLIAFTVNPIAFTVNPIAFTRGIGQVHPRNASPARIAVWSGPDPFQPRYASLAHIISFCSGSVHTQYACVLAAVEPTAFAVWLHLR